jgi:hypothetical protein
LLGVLTAIAVLVLLAMPVSAQAPVSSFSALKDRLTVGRAITVTDSAGRRTAGRLSDISEASLRLLVDGSTKTFSAQEVRRVQERRADSLINGLLIGGAAGAAYGVYWYIRDPNECGGRVCGSDLAAGAAVGAAIGLAIDAAIKKNITVYLASGPAGAGHRTLAPGRSGTVRAGVVVRWPSR